tara:strand:+ start:323 stop:514 length:192 start_codon:yes stop_codon:yes gene_type:complete
MAGVTPTVADPKASEKKPFLNVCPQCAHTKAIQRPASSTARQQKRDFKIRQGSNPAGLAAINN